MFGALLCSKPITNFSTLSLVSRINRPLTPSIRIHKINRIVVAEGLVVVLLEDHRCHIRHILRRNVVHRPHTSEVVPDMPCVNELRA